MTSQELNPDIDANNIISSNEGNFSVISNKGTNIAENYYYETQTTNQNLYFNVNNILTFQKNITWNTKSPE